MNLSRIDRRFRDAHPGDCFVSKRPFHALVEICDALGEEGYGYWLDPHPQGYMVHCTKSPHNVKAKEIH